VQQRIGDKAVRAMLRGVFTAASFGSSPHPVHFRFWIFLKFSTQSCSHVEKSRPPVDGGWHTLGPLSTVIHTGPGVAVIDAIWPRSRSEYVQHGAFVDDFATELLNLDAWNTPDSAAYGLGSSSLDFSHQTSVG
jgi:hypothetical protein